jgi:hypothetical protein
MYSMENNYQIFDLSNQGLTCEILETPVFKEKLKQLASNKQIKSIDLRGNQLTYIPAYLKLLPQQLLLDNNPIKKKVHRLNLSNQGLTCEILETSLWKENLQKLKTDENITVIDLSGNKLKKIPEYLLDLPQKLILDDNPLCKVLDKPKSEKRGYTGDNIKHTQDLVQQVSNFFSSKETKHSNRYKIIQLKNTVIIVAPGSNIKHQELDLNETKFVFISPQKQPSKYSWLIKYVVGGVTVASFIATNIIAGPKILELIQSLVCG